MLDSGPCLTNAKGQTPFSWSKMPGMYRSDTKLTESQNWERETERAIEKKTTPRGFFLGSERSACLCAG